MMTLDDSGDLYRAVYDVYEVGVSFVNDDAPCPSFAGFGVMQDLRLRKLPAKTYDKYIDLSTIGGSEGASQFEGAARFVSLLFMGRLSTHAPVTSRR